MHGSWLGIQRQLAPGEQAAALWQSNTIQQTIVSQTIDPSIERKRNSITEGRDESVAGNYQRAHYLSYFYPILVLSSYLSHFHRSFPQFRTALSTKFLGSTVSRFRFAKDLFRKQLAGDLRAPHNRTFDVCSDWARVGPLEGWRFYRN